MISSRLKGMARTALVVLGMLGAGAPATGAIYTGVWDPTFGADFPGLGWKGSATFFVPDGCLRSGSVTIDNTPDCGGAARMLNAQLLFYDIATPAIEIGQVDWVEADLAGTAILQLQFVSGDLSFLSTDRFPFFGASPGNPLYGPAGLNQFALQFVIDQSLAPGVDYSGVRLYWQNRACEALGTGSRNCLSGENDGLSYPADFRIFRIDEPRPIPAPGPAALLLIGLAALALVGLRPSTPMR